MKLGFWDYVTFLCFFGVGVGFVALLVLLLGLPGRIAHARRHPEAEAVNMMGWVGFMAVVPWIQALIWAFKPTDVVDIRRFPREEQAAEEEEYEKVEAAKRWKKKPATPSEPAPAPEPEPPPAPELDKNS